MIQCCCCCKEWYHKKCENVNKEGIGLLLEVQAVHKEMNTMMFHSFCHCCVACMRIDGSTRRREQMEAPGGENRWKHPEERIDGSTRRRESMEAPGGENRYRGCRTSRERLLVMIRCMGARNS